jgi:hypothetical protein
MSDTKVFEVFSAQTGFHFCDVRAASEQNAIDQFAQQKGYADRHAMWAAGRFEYVSAAAVAS